MQRVNHSAIGWRRSHELHNFRDFTHRHNPTHTLYGCDYRRGMNWWMDLLNTYTHHPELQEITALSPFSTLYKPPQHSLNPFPACCIFISRSIVTASNTRDSSASRAQVLSSQPPMQNSTLKWQMTTNSQAAAILHQPPSLLFTGRLSIDSSQLTEQHTRSLQLSYL
jgi:hypothetical protein